MWKKGFNSASGSEHRDVYARVTARIVADLEKGVRPWVRPWQSNTIEGTILRPLRHDGTPYRGINILVLWSSAMDQGFASPTWMTFRQALELGGHVRKGEHGSLVVYTNTFHKTEHTDQGDSIEKDIRYRRGYTVFNADQIDDLPEQYRAKPPPKFEGKVQRIEHAEQYLAATKAHVDYGGAWAAYSILGDRIRMPPIETFRDAESFYASLAHETVHWTRHPSRLNRDFGRKEWGDEGYAKEELVAEIGAAYLCADLELTPEVREDHAAYIDTWLKALKNDKRFIFTAASHAQQAVEYLHKLQPKDDLVQNPAMSDIEATPERSL